MVEVRDSSVSFVTYRTARHMSEARAAMILSAVNSDRQGLGKPSKIREYLPPAAHPFSGLKFLREPANLSFCPSSLLSDN